MAKYVLNPSTASFDNSELTNLLSRCMSHDLNNSLTFIYSRIELAAYQLDLGKINSVDDCRVHADKLRQVLPLISHFAYVKNSLDFLQLKQPPTNNFDIHRTISDLTKYVSIHFNEERLLSVDMDLADSICTNVEGAIYLQSLHFLQNAFRFSPENKEINLNIYDQPFSNRLGHLAMFGPLYSPEDSCVTIEVSDHGPGIYPENLPKIFGSDYSTRGIKTRNHGGIGLAMCLPVCSATHGFVEVESVVGKGTTFRYSFAKIRK